MTDRDTNAPAADPNDGTHRLLEHTAWMRALARRLVEDEARADDVVQDALATALAADREPTDARPWLGGVVRHTARNQRRGERRRRRREERAARPEAAVAAADELVARAEQHELLVACVRELREPYREAILLRYFEELELRVIAERLAAPIDTVRSRISRGLDQLREALDRRSGGDRRAWALAFVPLAATDARAGATAATASAAAGVGFGAWLASHTVAVFASAAAFALAVALFMVVNADDDGADESLASIDAVAATDSDPAERDDVAPNPDALRTTETSAREPVAHPALAAPRGRVVDLEGRPVAGVDVLRSTDGFGSVYATSAEDGSFLVDDLRAGVRLRAASSRHFALVRDVEVTDEGTVELLVTPRRTTSLRVMARDRHSGREVPRFSVEMAPLSPSGRRVELDSGPTLQLETLKGELATTVTFAEGLEHTIEVEFIRTKGIRRNGVEVLRSKSDHAFVVRPKSGEPIEIEVVVDLTGPERTATGVVAEGRVVDAATGKPIPGARVSVMSLGAGFEVDSWAELEEIARTHGIPLDEVEEDERQVQTFMDGRFRIALQDGATRAFVRVHHPHYEPAPHDVLFRGNEPLEIELVRRASLVVTVVDAGGAPRPGALVVFQGPVDTDTLSPYDTPDRKESTTDERGVVRFEHLRPGTYVVGLLNLSGEPTEPPHAMRTVAIAAGEVRELELGAGARDLVTARGTVALPEGLPGPYVPIFFPASPNGTIVAGRVDGDGYIAEGLAPGSYLVALTGPDGGMGGDEPMAWIPGVEVPEVPAWIHDFEFPSSVVVGRLDTASASEGLRLVVVPIGSAMTNAMLDGLATTRGPLDAQIDADGSFASAAIADGPHRLVALAPRQVPLTDGRHGSQRIWEPVAERRVDVRGVTDIGSWAFEIEETDDDGITVDVITIDRMERRDGR